ncbi:MAG: hypothetical protein ACD_3C00223G0023 [uncultured bacterium (gcode 4)]|uniref:Prepilin-type N-terminal cleavage/methylation domain-containing protein n=1 Tax=uncultured bacterium (gcode 4) TaxID=1234023 RepID=K2F842_9BACT|nr:MAG: hypothetical protein ACD_3C00223G0023 [uncultured bacterium (gcode 4)]
MHLSKNNNAFTLVELIVVIVILAILATIAFLSFSSQSASARDSTRLADMSNIAKWLSVFNAIAGKLPLPDSKIDITASWTIVWYQWYAWTSVLSMIKLSNWWKDPLDKEVYYTYSTNSNRARYQILWFLEDGNNQSLSYSPDLIRNSLKEANADPSSYSWRYSIMKWDSVWILLNSTTMVPVQTANANIDLVTTNSGSSYKVVFTKEPAVIATGTWIFSNMLVRSPELMQDKSLASMDNSLVAYWDMETLVTSWALMVLKDLSKYWNNWICYNSWAQVSCNSTWQWPKIAIGNWKTGKMMTFDGVDDWIKVINPQSVNFDYNENHTVYIKMKMATNQLDTNYSFNYNCILEKWWSWWYPFVVRLNNQNNANPNKVYYARYDTVNLTAVYDTVAYNESSYNDYVFIKSNSNLNLYKNGIYGSGITDISVSTTKNNWDLIIWADNGNKRRFTWDIDEIRIYNRALSDSEISALTNSVK